MIDRSDRLFGHVGWIALVELRERHVRIDSNERDSIRLDVQHGGIVHVAERAHRRAHRIRTRVPAGLRGVAQESIHPAEVFHE